MQEDLLRYEHGDLRLGLASIFALILICRSLWLISKDVWLFGTLHSFDIKRAGAAIALGVLGYIIYRCCLRPGRNLLPPPNKV
jgi:hypothetical protein